MKIDKAGKARQKKLLDTLAKDKESIVHTHRDMVELILRRRREEVMPLFLGEDETYFEAAKGIQEQHLEALLAYVAVNEPKSYNLKVVGHIVTPMVFDTRHMTASLFKIKEDGWETIYTDAQGKVYSWNDVENYIDVLRRQADDLQNFHDPWHNYVDPNQ